MLGQNGFRILQGSVDVLFWSLRRSAAGEPCAEVLAELVDHSLVVFGSDAERRRYGLHETIRQFAQEQLRGSDQEADALERHARYYSIPI